MTRLLTPLACIVTLAGCGSSDSDHPPLVPLGPDDPPIACATLNVADASLSVDPLDELVTGGSPVACLADGLYCPLLDAGAVTARCAAQADGGAFTTSALCKEGYWRLECDLLDGGPADAAGDEG